jgi:DNA replication protein DnaC
MTELIHERVRKALTDLRLHTAESALDRHLETARERELSHMQFLDHLLGDELANRNERSLIARTKLAHFPTIKTLDSFDFDAQPSLDRRMINELQTASFVERAVNPVLLGPPGVGKTHLSIGLGMRALQAGHRVYFLTAQDLLDTIRAAQLDGIPGHKQRHLNTVPLLILDEIGYLSFDKAAATWFFQLMCQRYEHRSTIITSNKSFAEWSDIFPDIAMAGALIDRLLHHSYVINLKGESYRMRSRKQGQAADRKNPTHRVGPP